MNVMQELKEWKVLLKMPIKTCNDKGAFLTKTYDDEYTSEIWKGCNIIFDLSKYLIDEGLCWLASYYMWMGSSLFCPRQCI